MQQVQRTGDSLTSSREILYCWESSKHPLSLVFQIKHRKVTTAQFALQEMVEGGARVQDFVSPEPLIELVQTTVKTPLDSAAPTLAARSTRVLEGLRIAKGERQTAGLFGALLGPARGCQSCHGRWNG